VELELIFFFESVKNGIRIWNKNMLAGGEQPAEGELYSPDAQIEFI